MGSRFDHQPDSICCRRRVWLGAGRVRQLYEQFNFDGGCECRKYRDTVWLRRYGVRFSQHDFDGQRFGHERGRVCSRRRYRCRRFVRRKQQHERERECFVGRGECHDRTRCEPLHGHERERPGKCQCGCGRLVGQRRLGCNRGFEPHQFVDRMEYRFGWLAVRIGRKPEQFQRNRKQSLAGVGGASFPATLVSFPALLSRKELA
ncbi:hypothetical protein DM39_5785 [Burkholderia cenocepacia]|uniref:Uncharacterized protein n=1 Tax=Burkholderia cenocepacia TaxID=95486 RepID=A0AAN0RWH6_9BURK|nr:hypothetical protein DM39_5785 [Burkholderia cenocepacia]